MAAKNAMTGVGDLLAEVFRRQGMKRGVRRAEAVLLWPQVVGRNVAAFSEAKTLQQGVLYVDVSDSETAMHLSFQRERFLAVYRQKFGVKDVHDVRFRVGRRRESAAPPPSPPKAAPDPRALAQLSREVAEAELPDNLSQQALQMAKAMLSWRAARQAEGWTPCTVCSALTPAAGMCQTCTRYAAEPRVRRAHKTLAVAPDRETPLLTEDERLVATYLAKVYLEERVQELLPQALAEPQTKAQLELAARCLLAHTLKKPLTAISEDDFSYLDLRIRRILGRWH